MKVNLKVNLDDLNKVHMDDIDDLKRSSFGFRSPIGRPSYFIYSTLVSFFLGRLGRLGRPISASLVYVARWNLRLTLRLTRKAWAT